MPVGTGGGLGEQQHLELGGGRLGRGHRGEDRPNLPAVWRIDLASRGPAKVFFGDPKKVGDDLDHLSEPRGIATDGTMKTNSRGRFMKNVRMSAWRIS